MEGQEQKKLGWPKKKKFVYLDKYEERVGNIDYQIEQLNKKIRVRDIIYFCVGVGLIILSLMK